MAQYYLDENGRLVKMKEPAYEFKNGRLVSLKAEEEEEDIAPVVTQPTTKKEDDDKLQFFQKSEGNWWQTILGTTGDVVVGAAKGVGKMVEGITDLAGYGAAGLYDLFGADELAERQKKRTSESTIDKWTAGADNFLDKYSVLGRTSDAVTQGLGQVAGIIATGGIAGAAGLTGAGVAATTTAVTGLSSMGAGVGEAYQSEYQAKEAYDKQIKDVDAQIAQLKKEDAVGYADAIGELEAQKDALEEAKNLAEVTDGQAWAYGAIKGVVDAGTELISGGLGKTVKATGLSHGIGGVDDIVAKKVSSVFQKQLTKNLAEFGVKASGEGFEEVLAGVGTALAKKATYMSEEEWGQLVEDENLLEQFVVGAITSGIAQSGDVIKDTKAGRDYVTKYTDTEQTVIDKVYEKRLAEETEKVTGKKKTEIYDRVVSDFEKGYITTDDIEEILGGDTYKAYSDTVKSEEALVEKEKTLRGEFDTLNKMKQGEMTGEQVDRREELRSQLADLTKQITETEKSSTKAEIKSKLSEEVFSLVKDTRLVESYNESARRGQAFTADLTKYDAKQKAVVQKAVESGILNNTNRTHEFVDMVAKISADKGVSFDFTNNAKLKESGFAVDGKVVNGFVTKDGVTLNIQSSKSLNSVVGHEITHVLEGTDLYNALQQTVIEYAKNKGDYKARYDALTKLYEGVEGANIDGELTADLVGDYLFTDEDFIKNLSAQDRNLFQKIYDEVKYLVKVATAGSKEARQLEKVKRAFDKAYRESGKAKADTETLYSLAMVEEVQPKTDGWQRGPSTDEVRAAHPTLYAVDEDATTERNPTQVKGTIGSYRKVYTALQNEGFNGTILDASSGLGYGTKAGVEEFGFDVEDIEPYPDSDYKPKYTDYSKLNKKYDVIISNAVLNVIPQDQRDALVVKMGELLNDGGRMFINVRGKDVLNASGKIAINEANMEYFIPRTAKTGSYQKGFTKPELVAYLEDALGNGFTVQPTNLFGAVSAIVTKNGGVQYSLTETEVKETNQKLGNVGLQYDAQSETVSFSLSSLEDAFHYNESETDYLAARKEYAEALAKATGKTVEEANRYLDSLFLIHDMIASDRDRLDYEAAVNRSAWVGNSEYGGSIDFSTLCAKRRLFTGTFDAIQNQLPDTVLTDNDFLQIRNMLLEKDLESPCSMCYVEGSRAKHGVYVSKWLKEYLKTDPEWRPQIADFTSTTRLEQTRIQHPEAYAAYQKAMNALSQRNPKEASVRTDYKGEILRDFADGTTVAEKNKNGGVRFNSFSDFEIIHALDAMQVITDMARVGLNGQAYTKVKEFAEAFGNTGLKINLSLVAKDVDADGKLIMDETNGMNYAEAMDIRSRYSDNVGTVIVVFNDAQLKAALADSTIDFVLPFHRSQWKKSQYTLMGLPDATRDYTNIQNDRYRNPKTGRAKKAPNGNIMPNEYWDFELSGRENAQKYLDYINENSYIPKFDFLLNRTADGKWTLPEGAVGDGYFKLLIDFKMYNNDGWGAPQNPVVPEFNMPYIRGMLDNYVGGHQSFPVAHDVVSEFVEGKKSGKYSLSFEGQEHPVYGNYNTYGNDIALETEDVAPVEETAPVQESVQAALPEEEDMFPDDYAPMTEEEATAIQDEALSTITDEDAPPVAEQTYDEMGDSIALEEKPLKQMAKTIAADLGLNRAGKAELERVIQTFSQNEHGTREDLYAEIEKRFGTYNEEHVNEEIADAKAYIRQAKIKVSDTVKSEFGGAKDYLDFMRKHFGAIRFSNDGVGPDQVYMQLNELHPGLFPDDIINPADQMRRIAEVAKTPAKELIPTQLPEEMIQEATDTIYDGITEYKDAERAVAAFDTRVADFAGLMQSADEYAPPVEEDIAPVAPTIEAPAAETPAVEAPAGNQPIKTVKDRLAAKLQNTETEITTNNDLRVASREVYDKEIARLYAEYDAMPNKHTKAAQNLLRRAAQMQTRRANTDADYAKRLSDLEAKRTKQAEELRSGESTTAQGAMRQELHTRIVDDAKTVFAERGYDFDEVLESAKDLSTFRTVDNTPQRVMEKTFGYEAGQILSDLTVNKVAQHETEGIEWLNSFTDRKNGLIAKISKQYNIKPGSKKSAAAQMYAEGFYVAKNGDIVEYGDKELARDFPDARDQENIKGLAKDPRIRQIYDETLAKINESRARNAYPEIQKLDNYFLHFRAMNDTFSKLGIPFNPNDIRAKDLPTDLNGVTADLKPGQPYFASANHRMGQRTSFDLLGGLEMYLTSAKDQIYHIDDIQTLRALRNYIADTYGQAKGLEGLDLLTEEEAQKKIEDVYKGHLSNFAKFLNEEANVIAGKTSLTDRGLEGVIGRRGITFLGDLNKQVGSNMVGFNVSSSLTNLLSTVQAFAKTNKFDFVKALAQTTANKVGSITGKTDGFTEASPVIVRRKGAERFHRTMWQKASDAGYVLMGAVDNISTEIIARAKYNELTRKGMDSKQAHIETDKWVSRLMGDRSLGQQPLLYNSKMLGMFTKFQLEVRNQLDSQFYDTVQEAKMSTKEIENGLKRNAITAAKVGATFFQLAVLQHVFGKAFESVAGYNPAFDIIDVLMKTFGWDDEEDDEDTALDNVQEGFLALMGDLPYTSTLTGGRIPISSALPVEQFVTGKDQYGNEKSRLDTIKEALPYYVLPSGYSQIKKTTQGLGMFDDEHPVAGSYTDSGNLRFPVDDTFGNRVQAGIFGQWASENARDYFDDDLAPLKEKQIQEFVDSGMSIQDYRKYRDGLKDLDKQAEKVEYINGLNLTEQQKNVLKSYLFDEETYAEENPEKYAFLENEGIGYLGFKELDEDAKEAWSWAFTHQDEYRYLKENGVYPEDYSVYRIPMLEFDNEENSAYEWAFDNPEKATMGKVFSDGVVEYRRYTSDLYNIKADKDEDGKSISGSRKDKVIDYINGLDADYGAKIILLKSEYPSDDTYNYDIIDYLNERDDISRDEMITILRELGFTVYADGTIEWE